MIPLENDVTEIQNAFTEDQKVEVKIETMNQPVKITVKEESSTLGDNDNILNEDKHNEPRDIKEGK